MSSHTGPASFASIPPQQGAARASNLAVIALLTLVLLLASWWLIGMFAGRDALLPQAWAGTIGEASALESPPYVGLELQYHDGQQRSMNGPDALWVQHRTTKVDERTGQLVLHIENRSPVMGDVVVYLTHRPIEVAPGERATITGTAELTATDKQAQAGLGFHALNTQSQYVTQLASDGGTLVNGLQGPQPLLQAYARPLVAPAGSPDIAYLAPRLAVYNIASKSKLDITLKWSPTVKATTAPQASISVEPWPSALGATPGTEWRFDVFGSGQSKESAKLSEFIELRRSGEVVYQSAARPAQHWVTDGPVRAPWRLGLPSTLPAGQYEAQLMVKTGSGAPVAHPLGPLNVGKQQGMLIGQTFHRYPGVAEQNIGPLKLQHQFVRSFAGPGWDPNEWWPGIDRYDWKNIDRWAQFHAPKGGRRLLITFSGTPTWASAVPDQPSSMQLAGYAAPPRKSLYQAYGRMVKATVEHLQGRVMGVECWNEPDLAEFFTGTSTELADLCALVKDNTKAIDPSIPVICPQTTSPHRLALVMNAQTSDGRKLHDLCDYVGSHVYGALGDDAQGNAYDTAVSVANIVRAMQTVMAHQGVHKPIAITEYGPVTCSAQPSKAHPKPFASMSSEEAGEALYQSLATLKANGVGLVSLYSYDEGNTDPRCRPGGSRVRMLELDETGRQRPNVAVVERFNQAVRDLGSP